MFYYHQPDTIVSYLKYKSVGIIRKEVPVWVLLVFFVFFFWLRIFCDVMSNPAAACVPGPRWITPRRLVLLVLSGIHVKRAAVL